MSQPGTGGLVPPPINQPASVPLTYGVQPGVSPGVFIGTLVIVAGSGPGTGIFVYSGTPAAGNSPIFWATSALADPYGNTLPSHSGIAGTGTFQAGNSILNTSGLFVYTGTPGAANLGVSSASAAGTTPGGQAFPQGFAAYFTPVSDIIATVLGVVNSIASLYFQDQTSNVTVPPAVQGSPSASTGNSISLFSGQGTAGATSAAVTAADSLASGDTGGLAQLHAGVVTAGTLGNWTYNDNTPLQTILAPLLLGQLGANPAASATGPKAYGDTNGRLAAVQPSGWSGAVVIAQTSTASLTITNTAYSRLSALRTINLGDANTATAYRMKCWGHGTSATTTAVLLNIACGLNGSSSALAQTAVPVAAQAAGGNFFWEATLNIGVLTTGAGGTITVNITFLFSGASANGYTAVGGTASTAFNTTVSNTIEIDAKWFSATGAPTLTSEFTTYERVGS